MNRCDRNAECINQIGGYLCRCKNGFYGNGMICQGKLKGVSKSLIKQVRGRIISTFQPYRADEKWESTFQCDAHQFIRLKFDSMDITDIAIDILKIQFMTLDFRE